MSAPPEEAPRRSSTRWIRVVSAIGLAVVATPVVAALVLVGPYLRDDRRLDRVVRVVALDWRDFGREAAITRLQYELDHQHIGMEVRDDDCALDEPEPGVKEVRCAWHVDVTVPLTSWTLPLDFGSDARIQSDGDLQ